MGVCVNTKIDKNGYIHLYIIICQILLFRFFFFFCKVSSGVLRKRSNDASSKHYFQK